MCLAGIITILKLFFVLLFLIIPTTNYFLYLLASVINYIIFGIPIFIFAAIIGLFYNVSPSIIFLNYQNVGIMPSASRINITFFGIFIFWFFVGAIIGLIVGKIKSRRT